MTKIGQTSKILHWLWLIATLGAEKSESMQYMYLNSIQLTQLVVLDGASKDAQNPSFTLFFSSFFFGWRGQRTALLRPFLSTLSHFQAPYPTFVTAFCDTFTLQCPHLWQLCPVPTINWQVLVLFSTIFNACACVVCSGNIIYRELFIFFKSEFCTVVHCLVVLCECK